ncbi:unnamed protein product [Parnassius mnemosyne]|uniref:Reverse transcriptase domain-containing protein n=1 Tax=Parnassius mnemosyne TaxID=213953 RepID=A0AAV1LKL6_9NEOP
MGDIKVNCLLYADDAVLIAPSEAELQALVTCMKEECEIKGLRLNANKTKVLVFERDEEKTKCEIWRYKNTTWLLLKICIKIILNQVEIFLLSKSAQKMQNNVDTLKRSLAKLLTYSLQDIEIYRATKDLLRFVSKRPLQIRAFGSIVVDMSLPPTCIMLFTSYTVIALQFNNVL